MIGQRRVPPSFDVLSHHLGLHRATEPCPAGTPFVETICPCERTTVVACARDGALIFVGFDSRSPFCAHAVTEGLAAA